MAASAEGGSGGLGARRPGAIVRAMAVPPPLAAYSAICCRTVVAAERRGCGGEGQRRRPHISAAVDGGIADDYRLCAPFCDGRGGRAYGADGLGGNGGIGQGGHVEAYANNARRCHLEAIFTSTPMARAASAGATGHIGRRRLRRRRLSAGRCRRHRRAGARALRLCGRRGRQLHFGVYSGNGTGGTITVISRDGTSSLTVAGEAYLGADGEAGYSSECSTSVQRGRHRPGRRYLRRLDRRTHRQHARLRFDLVRVGQRLWRRKRDHRFRQWQYDNRWRRGTWRQRQSLRQWRQFAQCRGRSHARGDRLWRLRPGQPGGRRRHRRVGRITTDAARANLHNSWRPA